MNAPLKNLRIADHPVHAQFLDRWSPRAFTAETMRAAEVLSLLEAARWAPSSSNMQPWRFVYALRGDAGFTAVADALVPFNRAWAEKAAALIVVASKTTVLKDEAQVASPTHAFDTGAAWAQLALQAHLSGWAAHGMGGFDHAKLAENVKVPDGYALHAVVAVGRQGNPASLPEMLQAREHPSDRISLSEVARRGSFS